MQELTQQEVIGFLTTAGGSMLLSYLWTKFSKSTWFPLLLWGAGTTTWFLYNQASNNPFWFMNLTDLGTILGSIGCIGLGLFMALQTFMMFELTAKISDDKTPLLFPLIAVVAGIVLSLIKAGYIGISPMWIWGTFIVVPIIGIIAIFNDFEEFVDYLGYLLLYGCALMYVYTFTAVTVSFVATVSGAIILGVLFMSSRTRTLLTYKSNSPSDSTTLHNESKNSLSEPSNKKIKQR